MDDYEKHILQKLSCNETSRRNFTNEFVEALENDSEK